MDVNPVGERGRRHLQALDSASFTKMIRQFHISFAATPAIGP
jgi:hypothetical protein